MSEKISLTAQTVSRLPEVDGETAVRFCPKCGRRIPADRDRCAVCANTGEIPRPRLPLKQKLRILAAVIFFMLLLLFGLDLAVRSAGPLPAAVPEQSAPAEVRGTSVPVNLIP